jgi:hypothetical protein
MSIQSHRPGKTIARLDKKAAGMMCSMFCTASAKSIHPRLRLRGARIKDALAKTNANTRKASREAPVNAISALPGCKPRSTDIRMRVFLYSVSPQVKSTVYAPCLVGSKGTKVEICSGIKHAGAKGDEEQGTSQRIRRKMGLKSAKFSNKHHR